MSYSIADQLMERRVAVVTEAEEIAQKAVHFKRDLTEGEQSRFDHLIEEAERLRERADEIRAGEARAHELEDSFRRVTGKDMYGARSTLGRYGINAEALRSHFDAITSGATASTREEFRAMATTAASTGAPQSWASVSPAPAISLREFAGITVEPLDGLVARHPSVTLPSGSGAGADEDDPHTEVTGIEPSTLSASRYGAWSNASAAVRTLADVDAMVGAHAVHISRSLTAADIGTIDAQAGTATAYASATFEQTLRAAVLTVSATAGVDPGGLVVYGQPAALAVATGYDPTNADDRGSVTTRLFGARVFAALAAAPDKLTFFAPAGFVAFESPMGAATTLDPKDGSVTFGSWLHSTAAGPAIVGAAKAIATA